MRRNILPTLLLICGLMAANPTLFSQSSAPAKYTNSLSRAIAAAEAAPTTGSDKTSQEHIPMLVKGDVSVIKAATYAAGGTFRYAYGNIARVDLPVLAVKQLAAHPKIQYIDDAQAKGTLLGDLMLSNNRVDSVHIGAAPLPMAYDGSGVVMGIIDIGIDYLHEDFKDNLGDTRIISIWDQIAPTDSTAPTEYGYGVVCDVASITDSSCAHVDPNFYYSHGSGVAGIAAGNGNALGKFKGVAPGTDLVIVNLSLGGSFLTNTVDAIEYVFTTAEALGKPCVINTSFGTYVGSHDGTDITTQLIEAMLDTTGRAIVAAAGNAGDKYFHLGYDVTSDTLFTWFEHEITLGAAYIQLWADTADFNGVNFSIGADNIETFAFKGETPWYNLKDYNFGSGIGSTTHPIVDGANTIGTVKTFAQIDDDKYFLEIMVDTDSTDFKWRLSTTGSGTFDVWSHPSYTGTSYMPYGADLPSAADMPAIQNYMEPDTRKTMVSSWQNSDKIITVGSYYNRDTLTNFYGALQTLGVPAGDRIESSSSGPTRDGRQKPDITASGQWVMTTASHKLTDWLIGLSAATFVAPGGQHYLQGGTSSSSPIVAGVAALYFERYPEANWEDVKNAIVESATYDGFTGSMLPDPSWGHGKLNAFGAMQIEPLEEEDTTITPPPPSGLVLLEQGILLGLQPNPVVAQAVLSYELGSAAGTPAEIVVGDITGAIVSRHGLDFSTGELRIDAADLSSGLYFYTLLLDGVPVHTERFAVQ